jgi:hypothetical protein
MSSLFADRRLRWNVRTVLATAIAVGLLGIPAIASAHVYRTVGPYKILVVLIEEPLFQDNHAGFEFWVRDDGVPVTGLDKQLRAQAIGHGEAVDLSISPLNSRGFYDVDREPNGTPFDPKGGGAWTLRLRGSINGLAIDQWFSTKFPGYPRVATGSPGAGTDFAVPPAPNAAGAPIWLVLSVVGAAILIGIVAITAARNRRRHPPAEGQRESI